jgi:hypothetical protein
VLLWFLLVVLLDYFYKSFAELETRKENSVKVLILVIEVVSLGYFLLHNLKVDTALSRLQNPKFFFLIVATVWAILAHQMLGCSLGFGKEPMRFIGLDFSLN